jgi:serine phosphatase RsbU (regulator of sigma subunit)
MKNDEIAPNIGANAVTREEMLRKQLAVFSMAGEISRVISASRTQESLFSSLLLGLNEVLKFSSMALFQITGSTFSMSPFKSLGIALPKLQMHSFKLGFMDGEYGDAIFRNKHIIVDAVAEYDSFAQIHCTSYAVFPIMSRKPVLTTEGVVTAIPQCPLAGEISCWTRSNEAQFEQYSEDEKRALCSNCDLFECLGLLWLDLSDRDGITGDEVAMISSITDQTALVLDNLKIQADLEISNNKLKTANDLIQKDLRKANSIQERLLPRVFPSKLTDVAAQYVPASRIGGDYYDCFTIGEHELGILVADVSGHGIAAALLMSMFKMLVKTSADLGQDLCDTLNHINSVFIKELGGENFVTLFYGIFNTQSRTLTYVNAGHETIIAIDTNGGLTELGSTGMVLGMLEEFTAKAHTISLPNPTRLVLFTDGLTEASNPNEEQFGRDRLVSLCYRTRKQNCAQAMERIQTTLASFCNGMIVEDDITLLLADI